MDMASCGRCGGVLVAGGALYSPVRMSFRPSDSKFLTLQTGDVMTKAMMCRDCGVIEIIGDVTKLKRLIAGTDPTSATAGAFPRAVGE
jgi:ribosomal protein S27AE